MYRSLFYTPFAFFVAAIFCESRQSPVNCSMRRIIDIESKVAFHSAIALTYTIWDSLWYGYMWWQIYRSLQNDAGLIVLYLAACYSLHTYIESIMRAWYNCAEKNFIAFLFIGLWYNVATTLMHTNFVYGTYMAWFGVLNATLHSYKILCQHAEMKII